MNEALPQLIKDLALILILAGVVTVVFKRLKQPLVLGYIVAGFLAGPSMSILPTIGDKETIEVWSKIGVIFLMFSLGLEFSFKKIVKSGIAPIFTSSFIMICMLTMGVVLASQWNWNYVSCIYLGSMLCMSSTTIIYKAYADMGLSNKRFAGKVMSVLVFEDILGILLMALLTSIGKEQDGYAMTIFVELGKLAILLSLWFLVGIWLIPSFLRHNSTYINKEMLIIVSIGLCFLMVVFADRMGYTPALGAFMMGSILAETIEAERITASISPIKDLFGAIFFVSVGMLVEPSMLIEHWLIIIELVGLVILGQVIFGTLGYLLSGSSLGDALQSGFSMTQIGEFAFIIATMGRAAGVLNDFIYPVIVTVSILTTFCTPYLIRMAMRFNLKSTKKAVEENKRKPLNYKQQTLWRAWKKLIISCFTHIVSYGILVISIRLMFFIPLLIACRKLLTHWPGNIVCGIITISAYACLLRPMVTCRNRSDEAKFIRTSGTFQSNLFYVFVILRFAVASMFIFYVLEYLSPFRWYYHIVASVVIMMLIMQLRTVKLMSQFIEKTFLYNLHRRDEYLLKNENPAYAYKLRGSDLHITRLTLPECSVWGGKTLAQLHLGGRSAVHVTAIIRDHKRLNIPGGDTMLFPNDVIEVLGDDVSIDNLKQRIVSEVVDMPQQENEDMQLQRLIVQQNSAMEGLFIKHSGIRNQYRCMVVGFEDKEGNLTVASADHKITHGDIMWVAGEHDDLAVLKNILCEQ